MRQSAPVDGGAVRKLLAGRSGGIIAHFCEPIERAAIAALRSGRELVNLSALVDDAKCFAVARQHRWPQGVRCPGCDGDAVIRDGCDDTLRDCQRYRCKTCGGRFDDLTDTVLAGHHQPLRVWVLCLYFMGLTAVAKGSLVHTDEYAVYARLPA